ncbi:unnamed protein product [Orchesella dallaii]|uniref:CHK kinase-like domain-containing protein n=1 Tax=Orchesella dallaii TaxID=48710 RepID=A0ABP1R9N4_9HEXA
MGMNEIMFNVLNKVGYRINFFNSCWFKYHLKTDCRDYHNNNMMFLKDTTSEKIVGHIAIDLQMVNYNSPAIDLSVYLHASVNDKVRQDHLQEILTLYFSTLKETTKKLSHPMDLNFEEFYAIYQKKLKFGFWFGFCLASDARMEAMKDIDITEMEGLTDFSSQTDKLIQKWVEKNPDKGLESARKIVGLVNEYYSIIE